MPYHQVVTITKPSVDLELVYGTKFVEFITARGIAEGYLGAQEVINGASTTVTYTWQTKQHLDNFRTNNAVLSAEAINEIDQLYSVNGVTRTLSSSIT